MYGCGLRASEAIGLEIGDVDLRRGFVRPHGKGSKERIVPLGSEASRAIERYLRSGRPELVGERVERKLFVNFRGGAADPPGPLQDHPAPRQGGRARGQDEPAHPAPHLRHPPALRRLRPALGPGDARPRRRRDDPALHAPLAREDQGGLLQRASAGDGHRSDQRQVSVHRGHHADRPGPPLLLAGVFPRFPASSTTAPPALPLSVCSSVQKNWPSGKSPTVGTS